MRHNKIYAQKDTKRQWRKKKWLIGIFVYAVVAGGGYGWAKDFMPDYAHAEVNIVKPIVDNRTIKEQVWDLLDSYGLTIDEKIKAVSIIDCESKWDKYAVGVNKTSRDYGLWQINSVHKLSKECMFDIECATKWAVEKYRKDKSWKAWTCN
jgi:hypothetical protein